MAVGVLDTPTLDTISPAATQELPDAITRLLRYPRSAITPAPTEPVLPAAPTAGALRTATPAEDTPRSTFNAVAPQTNYYATDTRTRSQAEMIGWLWLMQSMNSNLQTQGRDASQLNQADMNSLINNGLQTLEGLGMPAETINSIRSTINQFGTGGLVSSLSSGNLNLGGRNINWQNGALLPTDFDSARALRVVATDNAQIGLCARGTRNILTGMGYNAPTGNANTWDEQLRNPRSGYTLLRGVTPGNAPEGTVLFYDSDVANGRRARNEGGGLYGHVEVVAMGGHGERLYLSSHVSRHAGGSVPNNFEGAYIYTGPGAPPQNLRIASMHNSGSAPGMALNV